MTSGALLSFRSGCCVVLAVEFLMVCIGLGAEKMYRGET